MGRASIIEAYIQRLLELDQPITPSVLDAIIKEVGITKGELEAINLQVKVHLTRGHNYLEFGYFDKAIEELNQARSLDPINIDVLHTLADIHNERYYQDSSPVDRKEALLIAKRCRELRPHDKDTVALVKSLERKAIPQELSLQTKPNIFILLGFLENVFDPKKLSRRTKTKIALLILFLQQPVNRPKVPWWLKPKLVFLTGSLATVGVGIMGLGRLPVFSNPVSDLIIPGSTFSEESAGSAITFAAFAPGPNVPVAFNYPGLVIDPKMSRLGKYRGEAYYKLHGTVINDSGQDVRKLYLKVELLNGDGVPISTVNQVTVSGNNTIIRPGDARSFRLFHKITPELISVRVSVIDIEQVVGDQVVGQTPY